MLQQPRESTGLESWSNQQVLHYLRVQPSQSCFFPIIKQNAHQMNYISTLRKFSSCNKRRHCMFRHRLSFDQPLQIESFDITHTEDLPVVCKAWGFSHTHEVFWEHWHYRVTHIISCKAVARAVQGNTLAESLTISFKSLKRTLDFWAQKLQRMLCNTVIQPNFDYTCPA